MDEGHDGAVGARPGFLIDEPDMALSQLGQGPADVVHAQRDVMQAGPAPLDKSRDGGIR